MELGGLGAGRAVQYQAGSPQGWSDQLTLHTPPAGTAWQPSLAVFGDLGNENAVLPNAQCTFHAGHYYSASMSVDKKICLQLRNILNSTLYMVIVWCAVPLC